MRGILLGLMLLLGGYGMMNAQPPGGGKRPQGGGGRGGEMPKGVLMGRVVDAATKSALEYATVTVFSVRDSSFVTGGTTNEKGLFAIETRAGRHFIKVEFISFEAKTIGEVIIKKDEETNIGDVELGMAAENLGEVEVRAEKSNMQIMLDKKVFNVGQDLANRGGSAEDILDNVPSVTVDIDGNVNLRGNSNVRILVDGKPSGLVGISGTDGLKQIPANLIDRIEVITNPSARYEAEGTVGIINIILKKDKRKGINGSVEVSGGYSGLFADVPANANQLPINLGTALNLNYRKKDFNFFINAGVNQRSGPGGGSVSQEFYRVDTSITINNRSHIRGGKSINLRLGSDYYFTEKDVLTAAFLYRPSINNNYAEVSYEDSYLHNGVNIPIGNTLRADTEEERQASYEGALTYRKDFKKKDRKFTADFRFQNSDDVEDSKISQFFDTESMPEITSTPQLRQTALNSESENNYQLQMDYVHPFKEHGKFEIGYRGILRTIENEFEVQEDTSGLGDFYTLEAVSDKFIYKENIQAAYMSIGNKINKFSYQVGLRYEYAEITTQSIKLDSINARTYASPFFPSVFLSYDLPKKNAMQLSYSRRVRRPGFRELNPFYSFTDARNRYGGNPNLNPEFTHSLELSHIKYFEKVTITSSIYYRLTNDNVERLRRIEIQDGDTLTIMQPVNLDRSYSYGLELTFNAEPTEKLRFNGSFNFFRAIIPETVSPFDPTVTLSNDAYNWTTNVTARYEFNKTTNGQLRFNYTGPSINVQGSRKAVYFFDLGFSKEILKGNGTFTLSMNDIFNTRKYRYENYIEDELYMDGTFQRRAGTISATVNYRINQKKQRGGGRQGGGGVDMDGGGGF